MRYEAVPAAAALLEALVTHFAAVACERVALKEGVKAWAKSSGIALKDVAQPARVPIGGRSATPGLFEVTEVVGTERRLARLRTAAARARR